MKNHENNSLLYINLLIEGKDASELGETLTSQHRRNCKYYVETIKRASGDQLTFRATSYNSIRKLSMLLNETNDNLGSHILKKSSSYKNAATRIATIKKYIGKDGFHTDSLTAKETIKSTDHLTQRLLTMLRMMAYANVCSLKELKGLITSEEFECLEKYHTALECSGNYIDIAMSFTCSLLIEASDIPAELISIRDEFEVEPSFAKPYLTPIVSEAIAKLISEIGQYAVN